MQLMSNGKLKGLNFMHARISLLPANRLELVLPTHCNEFALDVRKSLSLLK